MVVLLFVNRLSRNSIQSRADVPVNFPMHTYLHACNSYKSWLFVLLIFLESLAYFDYIAILRCVVEERRKKRWNNVICIYYNEVEEKTI